MTDIFPGPSKHPLASASPNLHHLPYSPSLTSLEADTPFYAPTLAQDPSVIDLTSQSDIIIAYVNTIHYQSFYAILFSKSEVYLWL